MHPHKQEKSGDIKPPETFHEEQLGYVVFKYTIPLHLNTDCIFASELSLAYTSEDLYQGNYFLTPNVYKEQLTYRLSLEPGKYWYRCGIICTCSDDYCRDYLFPGLNGGRYCSGYVVIEKGKTKNVFPSFY